MKKLYVVILLICSCSFMGRSTVRKKLGLMVQNEIIKPEFQAILDSANVNGAILIYDLQENMYYSNDFEWAEKGQLPASTFKIPNSIIALETGVVESDSTLFKWNGEPRAYKTWEQNLILKDAFQLSCVPCYQEIARKIGATRMIEYVTVFNYGSIQIDSASIDNFWLAGDSKINQLQQISFLKQFYQSELPISKRTERIMKKIIILEENSDFKLSGKTGWSNNNEINNGWFVGFIEAGNNEVYFFATNIEPKEGFNLDLFPVIRKEVTYKALKEMDIMK